MACQLRAGTVHSGGMKLDEGELMLVPTPSRKHIPDSACKRALGGEEHLLGSLMTVNESRTGGFAGRQHNGKGFFFRSAWPDSAHSQSETELVPGATWVGGKMTSEAFS